MTYRDLRILNSQNQLTNVYNLTTYDLTDGMYYATLRSLLLQAAKIKDADGNGLPDDWETRHFKTNGVPTGLDSDHDQLDNFTEYAFGLDPSDGKRFPPVTTRFFKRAGQQMLALEFKRRAGATLDYTVESTADLKTWTKITTVPALTNLFDGTGTSLSSYSFPLTNDDATRFYRVRATPAKR